MSEQRVQTQEPPAGLTPDREGHDRACQIQNQAWEAVTRTPEYRAKVRAQQAKDRAVMEYNQADEALQQTPEYQAFSRAAAVAAGISKKIWPYFWR